MSFTKAEEIERKIGYSFKDKSLLKQAFTRTSYANEKNGSKIIYQSNEVLEFLGDSVLSLSIVTLLMKSKSERYENGLKTEWSEGDFSNIKSKLSDKKNLSLATERLGLQKYLLMGEGDTRLGVENEPSVKEDLFESIIGAIYVDSGYSVSCVMTAVDKLLNLKEYQKSDTPPMQSYKNALQEWCASKLHKRPSPVYKTVEESGPDHKKLYKRACYIGDKIYGVGEGKNQRIADTEAAKIALDALRLEFSKTQKSSIPEQSPAARLKEYAASQHKPSPAYKDKGESDASTDKRRLFLVECSFDGIIETGEGESKSEAKSNAILKVLAKIKRRKKPDEQKTAKTKPKRKKV